MGTGAASVVTLGLAVLCFVTLGLAVSALSPSSPVAQAVSVGGVVALSFVFGLFTFGGQLPGAVTRVADLLPIKPVAEALQDQFNPYLDGSGWDLRTIGLLLVWTMVAGAVATRAWSRPESPGRWRGRGGRGVAPTEDTTPEKGPTPPWTGLLGHSVVEAPGRPGAAALVGTQVAVALRSLWRDPGPLFFAVLLPLGLFALVATTAQVDELDGGVPFTVYLAAGMATWGLAVTAFMNIPESVVRASDRGVLKRLGGTPLPPARYLAGRVLAGVLVGVVTAALVGVLAVVVYGAPVSLGGILPAVALVALGCVVLSAAGLLLGAFVRNGRTFGAVALAVMLPVAFVSDIFVVGGPTWMADIGSFFPLRHLQNALTDVLAGTAGTGTWWHVLVLLTWGLAAAVLAVRFFRWEAIER